MTKFNNSLEIIKNFHFCYFNKSRFKKSIISKSKKKKY